MIDVKFMKNAMDQSNINGQQLAEMVGVSEAMISYILRGLRTPGLEVVVGISKALGCTVDDLIKY